MTSPTRRKSPDTTVPICGSGMTSAGQRHVQVQHPELLAGEPVDALDRGVDHAGQRRRRIRGLGAGRRTRHGLGAGEADSAGLLAGAGLVRGGVDVDGGVDAQRREVHVLEGLGALVDEQRRLRQVARGGGHDLVEIRVRGIVGDDLDERQDVVKRGDVRRDLRQSGEPGERGKRLDAQHVQARARRVLEADELAAADLADHGQVLGGDGRLDGVLPARVVEADALQVGSHGDAS